MIINIKENNISLQETHIASCPYQAFSALYSSGVVSLSYR